LRERDVSAWLAAIFMLVPTAAAALALAHSDPGNGINHAASLLALAAAFRLSPVARVTSARRALSLLLCASLAVGLVDRSTVAVGYRAFLGPIYPGRLAGLLQTPNVLAECAAMLIALALVSLDRGAHRRLLLGLGFVSVLAASSLTALIAAVATVCAYVTVHAWRRASSLVIVFYLGTAAAASIALIALDSGTRPITPVSLVEGLDFSSRREVWHLLLSQHIPFAGIGQAKLGAILDANPIPGATNIGSAHNAWLDAYIRDGWVGLSLLLAAVAVTLAVIWSRRSGMALVPLTAFFVESLTEVTPTHVPFFALYYAAITYALTRVGEPTRTPSAVAGYRVDRSTRAPSPVGAGASLSDARR
jgi:O-antigen ligase